MPVEQLAEMLLAYARADAALPRRAPANDDGTAAPLLDDMQTRIETLPRLRRENAMRLRPEMPPALFPAAEVASNRDLEELVALALTSAHEAEDGARDAGMLSRRAHRGMTLAVALALVGMVVATAGAVGAWWHRTPDQQMAQMLSQMQKLDAQQQTISDRIASLHAEAALQQDASALPAAERTAVADGRADALGAAGAAQTALPGAVVTGAPVTGAAVTGAAVTGAAVTGAAVTGAAAPGAALAAIAMPASPLGAASPGAASPDTAFPVARHADASANLSPLHTTEVRVLPATPAEPLPPQDKEQQSQLTQPAATYRPAALETPAASASYAAAARHDARAPVHTAYRRAWHPRRPVYREARPAIVLPRPVIYLIGSMQRDMRLLFR
jgi:hypothetical protein